MVEKKKRTKSTNFFIVSGIGILSGIISGGLSFWIGINRGNLLITTVSGALFGLVFGVFYGVYYIMER